MTHNVILFDQVVTILCSFSVSLQNTMMYLAQQISILSSEYCVCKSDIRPQNKKGSQPGDHKWLLLNLPWV